jgi:tetratricopeptide (TPR) repeat protein
VFLGAAFVGRTRGRRVGVAIVFAAATSAALVTILHGLVGATRLYGFYQPSMHKTPWTLSPLLNPNNFAGYLNLGAFAGFGLLVARRASAPRWLFGLGVAIMLGTSFIAASRGGWASLIVGIPLLALSLWRVQARRPETYRQRWLVWLEVGGVSLFGLTLFLLGATEDVWKQLLDDSLEKLVLLDWTRSLILAYLWFGVGRGAFETAFPAYRGDTGHRVYQHAENFVAQWCAEWGVPVAALALLTLFFLFRPRRLGADRNPVAASVVVGVVVLLLQNLMDLALEVASVSIALSSLLGCLWGAQEADYERQTASFENGRDGDAKRSLFPALVFGVLGGAAILGAALFGTHPAQDDRARLQKMLSALRGHPKAADTEFRAELRRAIQRHPGDPYLPLLGALSAQRSKQNPLPWIGRAIERDPRNGFPHLLLARTLADLGAKEQAFSTLRRVNELDPGLWWQVANLATRITSNPKELAAVAPPGTAGARLLLGMANLQKPTQRAIRAELIAMAIERAPSSTDARLVAVEDLLAEMARGEQSEVCAQGHQEDCMRRFDEHVTAIAKAMPDSDRPTILRAQAWLARGKPGEAEKILAPACNRPKATAQCWQLRVTALGALRSSPALAEAERSYLAMACTDSQACSGAANWLAGTFAARRDWLGATELYERAARESGDPALWLQVARASMTAGLKGRAIRAINRARSAGGTIPEDLEQLEKRTREERILGTPLTP